MYRIMVASSGYYYVQQDKGSLCCRNWVKVSCFFKTLREARAFCKGLKTTFRRSVRQQRNCVVEYVA